MIRNNFIGFEGKAQVTKKWHNPPSPATSNRLKLKNLMYQFQAKNLLHTSQIYNLETDTKIQLYSNIIDYQYTKVFLGVVEQTK